MYLSRIELDLTKNATRRALSSPQVLHAAVENCFNDRVDKNRKLWRLDRLNGKLYLLMVSPKKPDFMAFAKQFAPAQDGGESRDYLSYINRAQKDKCFNFRLKANPVHNVRDESGERGKVYAHVTVEQKKDWLFKKAPNYGFSLDPDGFDLVETDQLKFFRNKESRPVLIDTAVFEGRLKVTEPDIFIQALTQGIGRAKAYGCGLLTIAGI